MRWLDEKEAAAAAPLGSPRGPPPADAAQLMDGAPTRHQELAEVRMKRRAKLAARSNSHAGHTFQRNALHLAGMAVACRACAKGHACSLTQFLLWQRAGVLRNTAHLKHWHEATSQM